MKLGALGVLAALLGCSSRDVPRAAHGTERGDCRPAAEQGAVGTCDPGLLCMSNLCVRPPPADCQAIADRIAAFELGADAEPQARAPAIARHKAACDKALVSKEQGACIERASDKWGAMQCAPAMFPEMASTGDGLCGQVMERIESVLAKQLGAGTDPSTTKMMSVMLGAMRASCEQDGWPDELKKCIVHSAADDAAMSACNAQMPAAVQQKISERMQQAISEQLPELPPPGVAPPPP